MAKVPTISQVEFMEATKQQLKFAGAADTPIKEAVDAAQHIVEQLSDYKAGDLKIEPPLTHDQFVNLQERTEPIVSMGKKALAALDNSQKTREKQPTTEQKGSFSGRKTSLAKS